MTSPATEPASTPVTAGTPVPSARPLFYKIPPADLPRFGDDRWDLRAAARDQHYAHAICRAQYPEPFREDAKLYALTLLTAVDDAPALRRARSQVPSVKTIISDLNCLSVFLRWLASRHITRFCDATAADLDGYLHHVQDLPAISSTRRRVLLIAVQRLHAYRELLPARCQLPGACLWQGASAAELASDPGPRTGENRAPRIHPDVMEPLLSAALLTAGTIAADLLPAGRRLFELRALAGQLGSGRERRSGHLSYQAATEYLHDLLAELASRGLPLPGQRDEHGQLVTDTRGLAIAARFFPRFLTTSRAQQLLAGSGLPLQQDMLRVTRFPPAAGHPWRTAHADTKTLLSLLRHVITACYVTTAYLSGARTGEVLNLRRGCITRDDAPGLVFMSGSQLKAGESRRERSPATIPWVVTGQTAQAVGVLEELFSSDLLFPGGWFFTGSWFTEPDRPATRRSFRISTDIASFITWFNTTVATVTGHPAIPADDHGTITAPRPRRTLAWHIVRRPGGRRLPVRARTAAPEPEDGLDETLLAAARRAAAEHQAACGQPITRDALRARLGHGPGLASRGPRVNPRHPGPARRPGMYLALTRRVPPVDLTRPMPARPGTGPLRWGKEESFQSEVHGVHECGVVLVNDCHFAVFSRDDLGACGAGHGTRGVGRDTRLGRAVGAPGVDVVAESFGEAGAVRAVSDGAEAGAAFWCFEALGGEVGDGVALRQGHGARSDDRGAQPAGDGGRLGGDPADGRVRGGGAQPDGVQGFRRSHRHVGVGARFRLVKDAGQLAG